MANEIPTESSYAENMEAAFFDLDKTVIANASMMAFRRQLRQEGLLKRRIIARLIWSHLVYMHLGADDEKMARVRDNVLKLVQGWDQERIRNIVRETIDEVITPIIYREALDLINKHREEGRLVVIISASPEEIVEPLAMYLGADVAIASRVKIDDRGRYTGEMEFYAQGKHKAHAIEQMADQRAIDLERSFAYSDSVTDTPMLESVGNPVAVNPDRALLRVATERRWQVARFTHPVPLANRPAVRRLRSPLVIGLGAAALAFALAIRQFRRRK